MGGWLSFDKRARALSHFHIGPRGASAFRLVLDCPYSSTHEDPRTLSPSLPSSQHWYPSPSLTPDISCWQRSCTWLLFVIPASFTAIPTTAFHLIQQPIYIQQQNDLKNVNWITSVTCMGPPTTAFKAKLQVPCDDLRNLSPVSFTFVFPIKRGPHCSSQSPNTSFPASSLFLFTQYSLPRMITSHSLDG